jgi:hypothetical protein
MRVILVISIFLCFMSVRAQTPLDYTIMNSNYPTIFPFQQTSLLNRPGHKPWQLSAFSGLNLGYGFLNGGSFGLLSAPVGLQLTRRLNPNWYAFASVSAGPALFNFNSSYSDSRFNKMYPGNMMFNGNALSVYSAAEAGFLYINDEKTFSISGSLRVERSSQPIYPAYRTGMSTQRPANRSF